MKLRIGHGYDLHRLVEGRPLILAGVKIPHHKGLAGHSDADVVTHAFIDSILGAAGLGDIGRLYPDTDERFKDADSLKLLADTLGRLNDHRESLEIMDSSITIIAEKPKLAAFIPEMEKNLLRITGLQQGSIRINAKTNEGVGPEGRQEAIAVHAVTLLSG
jgi:2-C-methyl-D-erythritol 2,4-cyclodiphosphate synthase